LTLPNSTSATARPPSCRSTGTWWGQWQSRHSLAADAIPLLLACACPGHLLPSPPSRHAPAQGTCRLSSASCHAPARGRLPTAASRHAGWLPWHSHPARPHSSAPPPVPKIRYDHIIYISGCGRIPPVPKEWAQGMGMHQGSQRVRLTTPITTVPTLGHWLPRPPLLAQRATARDNTLLLLSRPRHAPLPARP